MSLSLLAQLLGASDRDFSVHVVGNHMGASILMEILARRDRGMLPESFHNLFKVRRDCG